MNNAIYLGDLLIGSQEVDYSKEYLTFKCISGSVDVGMYSYNDYSPFEIEYKINNEGWETIIASSEVTDTFTMNAGDIAILRCSDFHGNANYDNRFIITDNNITSPIPTDNGLIEISGNPLSLCSYNFEDINEYDDYLFKGLFSYCKTIKFAHNLFLGGKNYLLHDGCFLDMFYSCDNLISAPKLPSMHLANECYRAMFYGTKLQTAPMLPAKVLSSFCYDSMFCNCKRLICAPILNAETLANYCYNSMFEGCKMLTSAPKLPATTLKSFCYSRMFFDCFSLTTAPKLPATTLDIGCYKNMLSNCISLTKAPKLPATNLVDECYNGMFHGCVRLRNAPRLLALILKTRSYNAMFYNCQLLNYIECLATNASSSSTLDWLFGVAQNGTFVKRPNISWPSGVNGIPDGWTVQDAA